MRTMRSRTIPRTLLAVSLVAAALVLPGCAWFHRWEAPTTYEFVGLKSSEAVYVEQVFRDRGVAFQQTHREPPTYEVTGIAKMKDLAALQYALDKAIKKNDLQVDLREASVNYSGLSGGTEVSTSVTINITPPDATVHIADGEGGNPWRLIKTDSKGSWSGPVNTAGVVTDTGGWVYVYVQRGSLERVYRVNVLSKKQERWLGDMPFSKPAKE
jgi:hypothetical protein